MIHIHFSTLEPLRTVASVKQQSSMAPPQLLRGHGGHPVSTWGDTSAVHFTKTKAVT